MADDRCTGLHDGDGVALTAVVGNCCAAWPYYLAIWVAIKLVTYVPAFSTWLPATITGHAVF